MESLRKMLVVLMTMVVTVRMVNASLVYVGGGKETWRPNVNFSEWSAHFGFDKKLYNVLEVNKTGYEGCHDVGFIKNITRGGRDVFQVNEAKTYYFINGGGSCFGGMKVAINVENPQPAPSPSQLTGVKSIKNGSPSRFGGLVVTLMAVLTGVLLAWAIL
ncbi:lamin-like protein [Populus alba x Populus x berolinensis]|nr:lamin-like protein [Populus alba x Populus x berolinensis]